MNRLESSSDDEGMAVADSLEPAPPVAAAPAVAAQPKAAPRRNRTDHLLWIQGRRKEPLLFKSSSHALRS